MSSAQFRINLHEAASMTLTEAVLVYRPASGGTGRAYASVHDVATEGGRPVILAGKPITPRAALRLAHAICATTPHAGFLPGNVQYADGETLAWWVPAQQRHIAFRCPDLDVGDRSAIVPHPALVFMVSSTKWLVWAHKGRSRPLRDSVMWQAPYFNVNGEGAICRGNIVTPTGSTADKISAWEDAFFRSYFTHPNMLKNLVRHPGGAHAFWKEMLDLKFTRFPERVLLPTGARLGELVERHARLDG